MKMSLPRILWQLARRAGSRRFLWRVLSQAADSLILELRRPADYDADLDSLSRKHQLRMAALASKKSGAGRLAGKVAIVTGAASGIGRAIAVLFAREGARVVVADINRAGGNETVSAIASLGGTGIFLQADVTSDASIREMVFQTARIYRRVDILVNNAGAIVEGGLLTLPPEQWQRALEINLTSVYRCCRFALPEMIKTGEGGSVIIMASVQGIAGFWESSGYAAAKGGLLSLTRQLARQFASQQIRVNAVSPGVISTPIFDRAANKKLMFGMVSNYTPAGFIGVPEDIAFASLFLASDESSYVTGTNLVVDGGMTMRGA